MEKIYGFEEVFTGTIKLNVPEFTLPSTVKQMIETEVREGRGEYDTAAVTEVWVADQPRPTSDDKYEALKMSIITDYDEALSQEQIYKDDYRKGYRQALEDTKKKFS